MEQEYVYLPMPGQAPPNVQRSDKADILSKIDPAKQTVDMAYKLQGAEFKEGKWVIDPELAKKCLSPVGAKEVAQMISFLSTINISISRFKDVEIKRRVVHAHDDFLIVMRKNWKSYGVADASFFYKYSLAFFTNSYAVMQQSIEGSTLNLIKGSVTENIVTQQVTQQKESSWNRLKSALSGRR